MSNSRKPDRALMSAITMSLARKKQQKKADMTQDKHTAAKAATGSMVTVVVVVFVLIAVLALVLFVGNRS